MAANACEPQLATEVAVHQTVLTNLASPNSALVLAEHGKRFALEQWLAASDQAHYRDLIDEKAKQARLRDRFCQSNSTQLQLVVRENRPPLPSYRVQLDPAHTQRVIRVTTVDEDGQIALATDYLYTETS